MAIKVFSRQPAERDGGYDWLVGDPDEGGIATVNATNYGPLASDRVVHEATLTVVEATASDVRVSEVITPPFDFDSAEDAERIGAIVLRIGTDAIRGAQE